MVGLKPSDVPPPLGVKMASAGAAACVADLFTFPLDTAKVRLQIQGEMKGVDGIRYRGVFGTISTMIRTEGPKSVYNGLVAGLQRQVCFASVRIGLYDNVKDLYTGGKDKAGIVARILAGCTTGAMAVSFAQPTDVVKVRFQAQVNLDGVARRYSGTMQAYKHIFQNEGLRGLWKGAIKGVPFRTSDPEMIHYCTVIGLCGFFRDATQHHEKRTGQLHGAGHVRPDQGGHPQAQTAVRQPSLSFCVCVWGRLCHHGDRFARGRSEDQIHELSPRSVQECHQLRLDHDDQRGADGFLQRVCALISKAGIMERCHVCLFRTNQESHDGHKEED
ncbi:mitochondrial brown fat uncoupling protein 1 isoform 1-T1 [Spinachia spinachia]